MAANMVISIIDTLAQVTLKIILLSKLLIKEYCLKSVQVSWIFISDISFFNLVFINKHYDEISLALESQILNLFKLFLTIQSWLIKEIIKVSRELRHDPIYSFSFIY